MNRQELLDRGWHPIQIDLLLNPDDPDSRLRLPMVERVETHPMYEHFRRRVQMLIQLQRRMN